MNDSAKQKRILLLDEELVRVIEANPKVVEMDEEIQAPVEYKAKHGDLLRTHELWKDML